MGAWIRRLLTPQGNVFPLLLPCWVTETGAHLCPCMEATAPSLHGNLCGSHSCVRQPSPRTTTTLAMIQTSPSLGPFKSMVADLRHLIIPSLNTSQFPRVCIFYFPLGPCLMHSLVELMGRLNKIPHVAHSAQSLVHGQYWAEVHCYYWLPSSKGPKF